MVADSGNHRLRVVDIDSGDVWTLAGSGTVAEKGTGPVDGIGTTARFYWPSGVVITLAGGAYGSNDGSGTAAQFKSPFGIALSPDGASAVVADQDNNKIRTIELATGAVTTRG